MYFYTRRAWKFNLSCEDNSYYSRELQSQYVCKPIFSEKSCAGAVGCKSDVQGHKIYIFLVNKTINNESCADTSYIAKSTALHAGIENKRKVSKKSFLSTLVLRLCREREREFFLLPSQLCSFVRLVLRHLFSRIPREQLLNDLNRLSNGINARCLTKRGLFYLYSSNADRQVMPGLHTQVNTNKELSMRKLIQTSAMPAKNVVYSLE